MRKCQPNVKVLHYFRRLVHCGNHIPRSAMAQPHRTNLGRSHVQLAARLSNRAPTSRYAVYLVTEGERGCLACIHNYPHVSSIIGKGPRYALKAVEGRGQFPACGAYQLERYCIAKAARLNNRKPHRSVVERSRWQSSQSNFFGGRRWEVRKKGVRPASSSEQKRQGWIPVR